MVGEVTMVPLIIPYRHTVDFFSLKPEEMGLCPDSRMCTGT